ncbi:MAG: leucine-rich repeat protein, partial [Clostridia bacterium]|nr:leucine-rich repeat protein [Clostridia bacterium]
YASDEVQGRVVMPDRFEDGYIKKIADGAFKKSSYEFDPSKKALDFRWSRYLTEIGKEAFEYNAQVKRMRIPEGVTSIQAEAFKYCQELEEIALPSSLEELGESAFQGCRFQEVEISNNVQEIPKNLFLACNFLTDVTLPEGVKTIGHSAFKNCILLTEIHIPSSVSVIENSAFKGCVELETVNFPSGLESIEGNAFSNCKNLKQVELTANIKTVGRFAFEGCDSLSVRISAGFTGDLEKVFCGIEKPSSFKEILVDENNSLYRAEDSRKLFSKDGKLLAWSLLETETEIVIPDGTVEIGAGVFSYGTQITAVSFSVGLKVIGENAFRECSIEQIVFPQGLQRIGSGAFSHTKLKKVVLPSSMEVCDSSFSGCPMEEIVYQEGVTSIFLQTYNSVYLSNGTVLPKSLKEIKGVNVQSKINKIYFLGTAEEWAQVTFSGTTTGSYQSENPPVYFYSEKEPEEEGNFWHYDQNGSPVVWD